MYRRYRLTVSPMELLLLPSRDSPFLGIRKGIDDAKKRAETEERGYRKREKKKKEHYIEDSITFVALENSPGHR